MTKERYFYLPGLSEEDQLELALELTDHAANYGLDDAFREWVQVVESDGLTEAMPALLVWLSAGTETAIETYER